MISALVIRPVQMTREALLRCAAAALSGFGVLFSVSYAWGHGVLLYAAVLSMTVQSQPRSPHFPLSFPSHLRYIEPMTSLV
jgi:hypothetical protein